jgi:hypothetical protein
MTNLTKTESNDNNDLVVVHLDRPRFVRFGHKALKQLTKLTGKKLEQMDENDFELEDLEAIMWCGLQADAMEHGETLKIEDMEDLLDKAPSFGDIMVTMQKALEQAFKRTEKEKN